MNYMIHAAVVSLFLGLLASCEGKKIKNAVERYVQSEYGNVSDLNVVVGEGDSATAYVEASFISRSNTRTKVFLRVEYNKEWEVAERLGNDATRQNQGTDAISAPDNRRSVPRRPPEGTPPRESQAPRPGSPPSVPSRQSGLPNWRESN